MNPLSTPVSAQPGPEAVASPETPASTREVRRFNGLFMLANVTFLLITWCCLYALA